MGWGGSKETLVNAGRLQAERQLGEQAWAGSSWLRVARPEGRSPRAIGVRGQAEWCWQCSQSACCGADSSGNDRKLLWGPWSGPLLFWLCLLGIGHVSRGCGRWSSASLPDPSRGGQWSGGCGSSQGPEL